MTMRKSIFLFFIALLTLSVHIRAQIKYPVTVKGTVTDDYFGTTIADPYRWLEDDNSEETKSWVNSQNQVTQDYLARIPFRGQVKKRLEEMWNYPRYTAPFSRGNYYYFYKNDGLQNQSVLYRQKGLDGVPDVFIDPNKLSADGTVALGTVSFSKSGRYCVYLVAQSGSDWQEAYLMDVESKQLLSDKTRWIKFSGISWKGDEGYFYSRYPEPDEKSKLSKQNQFHQVFYHTLGQPQTDDQLVFKDDEHPLRNAGAGLTEDGRFLVIDQSEGTSGNQLRVKDLDDPTQKDFTMLVEGFATEPAVVDNKGDMLLLKTNDGAPNYKVVLVDPRKPGREHWKTIIPEKKEVLQSVSTGGGYLFASYLKDASTKVYQYDYEGQLIREIQLPGIGSAGGFGARKEDGEFFYSFSSFNYPPTIFRYNIKTGKSLAFRKSEAQFNPVDYEVKQVFFNSKDGTRVPMFISHKKGLKLDGSNPTLLYGYGGFNIASTPGFSISNAFFMEQGGVYVLVNLRGGSEYGEAWHEAGMLGKKQNVFDDVIGAAEYMITNKYSSKEKLAIRGGSNGGLLVGATINQRPDLFKVAIPQVGVMDMLRYHKFTIGWAWAVEYGRSDKKEQFDYLVKYSPLHNIKKGIRYPATMVTTADHDDRVVPAHSFKYAATLQEHNDGTNPTLIRIESKAGHGAGKPTSKQIEEAADMWSFIMYNTGMTFKQPTTAPGKAAPKKKKGF
jgi:prolyl oligopeptidase